LLYRASKHDCDPCPLKLRCCPKEPARKIPRDVNEAARDLARGLTQTEGYRVFARQRKMIETGFADMKRNLGLRGLIGANDEFLLAATVQNLRRLAKAIWPSPEPATSPTTACRQRRSTASLRDELSHPQNHKPHMKLRSTASTLALSRPDFLNSLGYRRAFDVRGVWLLCRGKPTF
jgi:hypothetical protein